MNVQSLIEEYKSLKDIDLRYMLLKRDVTIDNIERDLLPFLRSFVIPILNEDSSLEIVDLLSREVLPKLFIEQMSKFDNLDQLVYQPLISNCYGGNVRQLVILQTLKNLLNKITFNTKLSHFKINDDQLLYQFIENIDITNNVANIPILLFDEVLIKLLKLTYNGIDKVVAPELLIYILEQTQNITTFDPIIQELLVTSFQLTSSTNVIAIIDLINIHQLNVVSKIWHKFNKISNIFFKFLQELNLKIKMIHQFTIDEIKIISKLLDVIKNFKNFYCIRNYNYNKTMINENNIATMINNLSKIRQIVNIFAAELDRETNASTFTNFKNIADRSLTLSNDDTKQEEYLQELNFDDDELEFEDDDQDGHDFNENKYRTEVCTKMETLELIKVSIQEIIEAIPIDVIHEELLIDKDFWLVCHPSNGKEVNNVNNGVNNQFLLDFPKILQMLNNSDDLSELSESIKYIDQYLQSTKKIKNLNECTGVFSKGHDPTNYSKLIYEAILPHLLRNKQFIKIIKVGNMKQKIDESVNLRLNIINILLTNCDDTSGTCQLSYQLCCQIIKQIVTMWPNESDENMRSQLFKLLRKILERNFTEIYALDEEWYYQDIYQAVEIALNSENDSKYRIYLELRNAVNPLCYREGYRKG